jgi:hypothetical protein
MLDPEEQRARAAQCTPNTQFIGSNPITSLTPMQGTEKLKR